jgi:hypothetical protein
MRILIPYYSRSGHTEQLALALADTLRNRGHQVTLEKIRPQQKVSKWKLVPPLLSTLPVLPAYLWLTPFRRWWLQRYRQPQMAIAHPAFPDVSGFDCICLGGPKWLYIAYPLARYLQQVNGLEGRRIGAFATFCGPPLPVFELEMLFSPLQQRIAARGGSLRATLAISSGFHEFFFFNEMEYVFRLISRLVFRRPLASYALNSEWGQHEIAVFCDTLLGSESQPSTQTA